MTLRRMTLKVIWVVCLPGQSFATDLQPRWELLVLVCHRSSRAELERSSKGWDRRKPTGDTVLRYPASEDRVPLRLIGLSLFLSLCYFSLSLTFSLSFFLPSPQMVPSQGWISSLRVRTKIERRGEGIKKKNEKASCCGGGGEMQIWAVVCEAALGNSHSRHPFCERISIKSKTWKSSLQRAFKRRMSPSISFL